MKPAHTEHTNRTYKLRGGTDENDLPTYQHFTQSGHLITSSVWVPTDAQRKAIADGENIRLNIFGNRIAPCAIDTTDEQITRMVPDGSDRGQEGREGEVRRVQAHDHAA